MFQENTPASHDTLIVPIAADLTHDEKGIVVVGPLTKTACDLALQIATEVKNPVILTTASFAGDQYGRVMMGEVMKSYLCKNLPPYISPEQGVSFYLARWFNTMGEVLAVAEYIQWMYGHDTDALQKVIFAVKMYHMPRLEMLVRRIFFIKEIQVPVEYCTHHVPIDLRTIEHERHQKQADTMLLESRIKSEEITRQP